MSGKINLYEKYMKQALRLARKGIGKTSPNPIVGAVLLDKNMNVIGKGWHKKYGEAHAEVNAINDALSRNAEIKGGTIIITLEPCSHFGKTPPCTDIIIKNGIKTVVAGCLDSNPKVSGKGIEKCQQAGIKTIVGIMEDECKKNNEIFFKNQLYGMPFVTIKTAATLDGKIATKIGSSKWITGDNARLDVQKLRSQYDAILTSSKTVIADNPSLTCRLKNKKNPVRIIVDTNLRTPPDSKVYNNDNTKVYLATVKKNNFAYPKNVEVLTVPENNKHVDLKKLLQILYQKGICSILTEAGGTFNSALIKDNLADKLILYSAPKILGDVDSKSFVTGFSVKDINECLNLQFDTVKVLGQDIKAEYYFRKI